MNIAMRYRRYPPKGTLRFLLLLGALGLGAGLVGAQAAGQVFEHRVVVSTTALDLELEVDGSLTRNVNRLATLGFEVGAIVAGDGAILDRMLLRRAYMPGTVDHAGHVFVIMNRRVGHPAPVREYRILNARHPIGVEKVIAGWASEGFCLRVTAWEGNLFHGVFERVGGSAPVEYRVLRNQGRRGWDRQMMEDPDVRQRLRRVVPITLDSAIVELGAPAEPAAEFAWESDAPGNRDRHETRLNQRAAAGFRAQLGRMRNNILDVAMLKAAGSSGAGPALDLDDGPWGGPCGRGLIVGADIWTDGDVYCVAEDPKGPVSNRGFDLVLRPEDERSDGDLFRGWFPCEIRSQMSSDRTEAIRVARALQMEREIQRQVQPGYRITRAFAGTHPNGEQRLVFFTTQFPDLAESGSPGAAADAPAPRLAPDGDALLQSSVTEYERKLNEDLEAELRSLDIIAHVEIHRQRTKGYALLTGCARIRLDREHAETVLRRLLGRTPYSDFRIRNEILIELIR